MKFFAGVMSVSKAEFAWPGGDRPGNVDFRYELPPSVPEAITRALAPSFPPVRATGARYQALRPPVGPVGRYKLSTPDDGSWFIRVSSRSGNPALEKVITNYLAGRGVNVNPLLVAGETLQWEEQVFRIDVRPLIEGRHFNRSTADVHVLAATLSSCHRALMSFPRAGEIRAAAVARSDHLGSICDRISDAVKRNHFELFCEHASWAAAHSSWLAKMVEQFDSCLHKRAGAQCLHGEIHPGNVIFRVDNGQAILVDFEESAHLFGPPAWDLAFLVQRFCLRDDPSPSVALQRLEVVSSEYGSSLSRLSHMMRQIAWFSIATAVDLRLSNRIVALVSEFDKFVRLEQQALRYEDIL